MANARSASGNRPPSRQGHGIRWAARGLAGWLLLSTACSAPESSDGFVLSGASDGVSPHALQLTGGQTGSDFTRESAGCALGELAQYELAAETPLGFSGSDVMGRLSAREVWLRWADGHRVRAVLSFSAGPYASSVEQWTPGPVECITLLRLSVTVTLSSEEPGLYGTVVTDLYALSPDDLAGSGPAEPGALGVELARRSGNPERPRLTYELEPAGLLRGWLSRYADRPEVVMLLSEAP